MCMECVWVCERERAERRHNIKLCGCMQIEQRSFRSVERIKIDCGAVAFAEPPTVTTPPPSPIQRFGEVSIPFPNVV